jgi:drug/metabolite transporter (DMT)-like permease
MLLALSALAERRGIVPSQLGVASFVYLVVVGTAAAHTVSIWLAARTNATFASSWTYISPFIALAFGALLLGETVWLGAWIGCVCVVAGVAAINYQPRPRRSAQPS